LGRFKGEMDKRYHLTPLASVASSGLQVKDWMKRLVFVRETENWFRGPSFCDASGEIIKSKTIEITIMDRLAHIQTTTTGIIPRDMDVHEEFGVSRSF
jgi:hypothetical protein